MIYRGLNEPEEKWRKDARCLDYPLAMFFPPDGAGVDRAIAICEGCLVREECLEYALENDMHDGVWGGVSERERKRIQKRRKKIAAAITYEPLAEGA